MKDCVISLSIENLRTEGLRFSIDTIAKKLKISKKTIYKFFPDKESLALAVYERYFNECFLKSKSFIESNDENLKRDLVLLYLDTFKMTKKDIFNKFKLNQSISNYANEKQLLFWELIHSYLKEEGIDSIKTIIDATFEKITNCSLNKKQSDEIVERLLYLI